MEKIILIIAQNVKSLEIINYSMGKEAIMVSLVKLENCLMLSKRVPTITLITKEKSYDKKPHFLILIVRIEK